MTMKRILILALLLFAASALFAEQHTRTVVVRDGKVISDTGDASVDLVAPGKRAFLGVSLIDISGDLREHFGSTKESGALVDSVEDGSPADKAGLRPGDVIVSVDGNNIAWSGALRRAIKDKKDGDTVRIEFIRGRARQTAVATLVEREAPRMLLGHFADLSREVGETFNSPEWKARIDSLPNCSELQDRLRELESRMKELEKKLQR
ncbi:MAG: PDZ domain-containing protein [Acidobacteria bacterium]|nr:PDZ domain-containing protein [Acidobacteriota bacterium]